MGRNAFDSIYLLVLLTLDQSYLTNGKWPTCHTQVSATGHTVFGTLMETNQPKQIYFSVIELVILPGNLMSNEKPAQKPTGLNIHEGCKNAKSAKPTSIHLHYMAQIITVKALYHI